MKNVRPLTEFENLEACDEELKRVFHELYPDVNKVRAFSTYVSVDHPDFFDRCPITVNQFKKMGLTVRYCYMITITPNMIRSSPEQPSAIHIDVKTAPIRIHWPVYNADSVMTTWFKYNGNSEQHDIIANSTGALYIPIEPEDCTPIEQHCFRGPTVFRVDVPHEALPIPGMPLPRMAFSFDFHEREVVKALLQ